MRVRHGLAVAGAIAVAGHAVVLALAMHTAPRAESGAAPMPKLAIGVRPMIARLVDAPTEPALPVVAVRAQRTPDASTAVESKRAPRPPSVARVAAIEPRETRAPVEAPDLQDTTAAPMVADASASHYWPTRDLEAPPLPRSEPDAAKLQGAVISGLPIRLRLYIDAVGAVAHIEVLQASDQDADVVDRMKEMFYDTQFLAGKRAGTEVAAYMDIEVDAAHLQ